MAWAINNHLFQGLVCLVGMLVEMMLKEESQALKLIPIQEYLIMIQVNQAKRIMAQLEVQSQDKVV